MAPKTDLMAEATRLTREGRLAEATALLSGRAAPRPTPERPRKPFRPKGRSRIAVPEGASWTRHLFSNEHGARPYALYSRSGRRSS